LFSASLYLDKISPKELYLDKTTMKILMARMREVVTICNRNPTLIENNLRFIQPLITQDPINFKGIQNRKLFQKRTPNNVESKIINKQLSRQETKNN
jgi:hypothetical protein